MISTGLTIFIGTAGLPHILTRFFTVPDSNAARKSVLYTIGIIATFTAMVTIIGFGARAMLGQGASEAVGKGGNLAAPLLAQSLGGGEGTVGGDIALALFSAAAFATILAVVAGLVIASAGAIAHDLWKNVLGRGTEEGERKVARIASVGVGVAAILGTMAIGSGFNVTVLVEHGVRVRGERELPAAAAGAAVAPLQHDGRADRHRLRHHRLGDHDRAQPAGLAGSGLAGLAVAADVPGPRDDPDRLLRLLAGHDARPRGRAERAQLRRAAGALGDRHRLRGRPGAATRTGRFDRTEKPVPVR